MSLIYSNVGLVGGWILSKLDISGDLKIIIFWLGVPNQMESCLKFTRCHIRVVFRGLFLAIDSKKFVSSTTGKVKVVGICRLKHIQDLQHKWVSKAFSIVKVEGLRITRNMRNGQRDSYKILIQDFSF